MGKKSKVSISVTEYTKGIQFGELYIGDYFTEQDETLVYMKTPEWVNDKGLVIHNAIALNNGKRVFVANDIEVIPVNVAIVATKA